MRRRPFSDRGTDAAALKRSTQQSVATSMRAVLRGALRKPSMKDNFLARLPLAFRFSLTAALPTRSGHKIRSEVSMGQNAILRLVVSASE